LLRAMLDSLNEEKTQRPAISKKGQEVVEKVKHWREAEVKDWLRSIGLKHHDETERTISEFKKTKIDGAFMEMLLTRPKAKKVLRVLKKMIEKDDREVFSKAVKRLRKGVMPGEEEEEKGQEANVEEKKGKENQRQREEKKRSLVDRIFSGTMLNCVQCMACKSVSLTPETFMDLSVAIAPPPGMGGGGKRRSGGSSSHSRGRHLTKAQRKALKREEQRKKKQAQQQKYQRSGSRAGDSKDIGVDISKMSGLTKKQRKKLFEQQRKQLKKEKREKEARERAEKEEKEKKQLLEEKERKENLIKQIDEELKEIESAKKESEGGQEKEETEKEEGLELKVTDAIELSEGIKGEAKASEQDDGINDAETTKGKANVEAENVECKEDNTEAKDEEPSDLTEAKVAHVESEEADDAMAVSVDGKADWQVVFKDGLNVRTKPDMEAEVVGELEFEQIVKATEVKEMWIRHKTGWTAIGDAIGTVYMLQREEAITFLQKMKEEEDDDEDGDTEVDEDGDDDEDDDNDAFQDIGENEWYKAAFFPEGNDGKDGRAKVVAQTTAGIDYATGSKTLLGKSEPSIQECLKVFTGAETLSEASYICINCTQKQGNGDIVRTQARKRVMIKDCPDTLTIHLKRFAATARGFQKVGKKVQVPLQLDMAPYCVPCFDKKEMKKVPKVYSLTGIVVHSGGLGGGHYVAYTRRGPNSWFYFSDRSYKEVRESSVLNAQAYLCFYKRIAVANTT